MKLRILFDNNILNKLVKCPKEKINLMAEKCELLNCEDLIEELDSIKNSKIDLYNKIKEILKKFQVTSGYMFGLIDWNDIDNIEDSQNNTWGFCEIAQKNEVSVKMLEYKDVEVYNKIHPNAINKKHENDRQIAILASTHNANAIITEDKDFYKHLKKTRLNVMTFEEFIKYLKI